MPVNQSRHAPLTSIATAAESQQDLSENGNDSKRPSISSAQVLPSPSRPYSPGMRSVSSPKVPQVDETPVSPGEIQMQSFADGAPPPPPPSHSWKKIDRWAEKNYEELFDNLCEGCSQNDVNELEHELDMTLPQDVRESLAIHDGQERGGRPTGIILGCMLLDCEEIVQEWNNWKVVNEEYLSASKKPVPHYPLKSLNTAASSSSSSAAPTANKFWRQDLLDRQDSQPPKAIQKAYAHPSWIPLARDWGGNNIAVDLAPGPLGKWGQIILFGRDYDCKYVVARSWSHFLSVVADDLNSDRVVVDEDSGEMKLKEFKTENIEPPYMEILRWRADQKYGRKSTNSRNSRAFGLNTNVKPVNGKGSPYSSPVAADDDRGRSPQRFSRSGTVSPRHTVGSPLARVQEENSQPLSVRTGGDVVKDFAVPEATDSSQSNRTAKARPEKLVDALPPLDTAMKTHKGPAKEKLVDAPTPLTARSEGRREFPPSRLSRVSTEDDNKENHKKSIDKAGDVKGLGVDTVQEQMSNVAI
jgi:cell wall assembly regulator SMI1